MCPLRLQLTRLMNRTTTASKEMVEQLVSLTTPPPSCIGPEVIRATEEFQDGDDHWGRREDTRGMACPAVAESVGGLARSSSRLSPENAWWKEPSLSMTPFVETS